jgi:hypothetical protein
MATTDVTELMNAYRECARNVWNVYLSRRTDIGVALDAFGEIQETLFDALIVDELCKEAEGRSSLILRVVPQRSLILIQRLGAPGQSGYWDQEKDMVVGPQDIKLAFLDYFDFSNIPIRDFRYYRSKILSFPGHPNYEGREALLEVSSAKVLHEEPDEKS